MNVKDNNMADNQDNLEFLISQYLDGQLDDAQNAKFRRRLETDRELARELQRYTSLEKHLADMHAPELDEVDFDAQRASIMSSLERQVLLSPPRRSPIIFRPAFWVPLAAAAMVVLAVTVGLKFFQHNGDSNSQVLVAILSDEARTKGPEVVKVDSPQLVDGQLSSAEDRIPSAFGMPAGTVMVSVSSPDKIEGEQGSQMLPTLEF